MRGYYVYILASRSRCLYVGVTNDLVRRVREHRLGRYASFTSRYRVHQLVHYEEFTDIRDAIAREKKVKRWSRDRKYRLIEQANAGWLDLTEAWPLGERPPS